MAGLPYAGPTPTQSQDLVNNAYLQSLLAENLPQDQVDTLITAGFAAYATRSYVDTQDALNATRGFIDAGDSTRLHLSQVGTASGPVALNASGKIGVANLANIASTQRWPAPFFSPVSYNQATVSNATSTETTIYSATVADPGFAYKLAVIGTVDVTTTIDGEYPVVRVRIGSTTGAIVAGGYGSSEHYVFSSSGVYLTPGAFSYSITTSPFDVVILGAGAGGQAGGELTNGESGNAGHWAGITLTVGGNLPAGTTTINGTVGAAGAGGSTEGAAGAAGGNTTLTPDVWAGLTATGGSGHGGAQTPGNFTFNSKTYNPGTAGQGGGGGGWGLFGLFWGRGGPGQPGGAWFSNTVPTGDPNNHSTATILPVAYAAQSVLTGATTLVVTLVRSGTTSTAAASTLEPALHIVPIPA